MDEMLEALNKISIDTRERGLSDQETAFCKVAYLHGKVDGSKEMARKSMEVFKHE